MTNNISELNFDSVLMDIKATSYKQVLQKLSEHTSNLIGAPKDFLLEELLKHEAEHSSGIGNGVAIAHMRLPRLTRPMKIFAKISRPVNFMSTDGEPVDLICLVLSPDFEGTKHLSRLAKVSRFFCDQIFCNNLRDANTKDEIRNTLKEMNTRRMAA